MKEDLTKCMLMSSRGFLQMVDFCVFCVEKHMGGGGGVWTGEEEREGGREGASE